MLVSKSVAIKIVHIEEKTVINQTQDRKIDFKWFKTDLKKTGKKISYL